MQVLGKGLGEWFDGAVTANALDLGSKGGARLRAAVSGDAVSGTVTFGDGSSHAIDARRAAKPAGLYRAEETIDGKAFLGGWIVLPGGEQKGSGTLAGT